MMEKFIWAYLIIGIVVAALPVLSKSYGHNYSRIRSRELIVGVTIVMLVWPYLFFSAFWEAMTKDDSRSDK